MSRCPSRWQWVSAISVICTCFRSLRCAHFHRPCMNFVTLASLSTFWHARSTLTVQHADKIMSTSCKCACIAMCACQHALHVYACHHALQLYACQHALQVCACQHVVENCPCCPHACLEDLLLLVYFEPLRDALAYVKVLHAVRASVPIFLAPQHLLHVCICSMDDCNISSIC